MIENKADKVKIDNFNQRIKLLDFDQEVEEMVGMLEYLAKKHNLGKIIYIGTKAEVRILEDFGFIVEAEAEGFFKGEKGYFLSKFTIPERSRSNQAKIAEKIFLEVIEHRTHRDVPSLKERYEIRTASLEDSKEIAALYDTVFETYPTPMDDPEYVVEVMQDNLIFKVATAEDKIVSIASADMDRENLNAEITDCATLPDHRGRGLMDKLIAELEKELQQRGYLNAYTIARATSLGMNIVFAKRSYLYGGRLINNCHICGQFEDMNVWTKSLEGKNSKN